MLAVAVVVCFLLSYFFTDNTPDIVFRNNGHHLIRWDTERLDELARARQQKRVDCSALYLNDRVSVTRAVAIAKVLAAEEEKIHGRNRSDLQEKVREDAPALRVQSEVKKWTAEFTKLTEDWYLNATQNCQRFRRSRGYVMSSLTKEEEEFPIAYSILVFKDVEMVERLLRSIYRPQNSYCIHVDIKSDPKFFNAVTAIARCFPRNVRMSSSRSDVQWATFTVLEPELVCMQDLWDMDEDEHRKKHDLATKHRRQAKSKKMRKPWKYFINLTGQEFPLKTNYQIVKIIKALKGANSEEGTRARANKDRWKSKAPYNIIPTKGMVHTVLNRATIDFILHSDKAKGFLEWVKGTDYPDETFFASINHNPQLEIPGTYSGSRLEEYDSVARYKQWNGKNCYSGQTVRAICILSTGDLPKLGPAHYLFANKFYLHQDRIVIGCLEEKLFNDTRDEYKGLKTFDTSFYSNQDYVINQVKG